MAHGNIRPKHPSQHRVRVRWWQQYAGLIGAPLAWMSQMLFAFAMADFGCGHLAAIGIWLAVAGLASVLACAGGGWLAYGVWRRTRHEAPGDQPVAIDTGEGRSRFFAVTGMLSAAIFTAASLITLIALIVVPPC